MTALRNLLFRSKMYRDDCRTTARFSGTQVRREYTPEINHYTSDRSHTCKCITLFLTALIKGKIRNTDRTCSPLIQGIVHANIITLFIFKIMFMIIDCGSRYSPLHSQSWKESPVSAPSAFIYLFCALQTL